MYQRKRIIRARPTEMHDKDMITLISHEIALDVNVCASFFAIILVVKYLRYMIAFTTVKEHNYTDKSI